MEAPAGLVHIEYKQEGKKVTSVKLTNVPAYLAAEGLTVDCPDLGELVIDVSYGGNFYAIVDVQENFSKDLKIMRPINSLHGQGNCANASMRNIHSYIPMIQPSMAARIFYGQALYWIKLPLRAMQFFMAIKPSTAHPAAPALLPVWRNGTQKEN
jgi:hypothetical protein